ncbi:hypothetical protein CEXT_699161 [Caerostris extrusa]|uniref:Uncharacterized protein n=1 Tax=Caerostris extrusa TaxID=172846 RepID=A0AAV4UVR4_CAEEX|nr:hypothetical protein CEXT_699161 [Caerostris extrusa]
MDDKPLPEVTDATQAGDPYDFEGITETITIGMSTVEPVGEPESILDNIISEIDQGLDVMKTNLDEAAEKANKLLGIGIPIG